MRAIIHDFVMVNALRSTNAAEDAITQAINNLSHALGTTRVTRAAR
jgi:acetyl esterase